MSELATPAQPAAGAANPAEDERLRLRLVAGAVVLALAIVAVVLRFHRLAELPPGLADDEGLDGVLALQVLQGEHAVFFPVGNGREASAIYAVALATLLWGRSLLTMHLPTALGSVGLVFVLFWLGQLLFGGTENGRANHWRGLCIGAVGAGLLAVSLGQTVVGRTAYNKVTHLPLLLSLCMALLWSGWSQRRWWRIALAGICAGLLPYTYIPARFTPLLFLLLGLSFVLPPGRLNRDQVRSALPLAGLFVGVTGLVAAPILVHFALHPDHFFMRSAGLFVFEANRGVGVFLVNVWDHLLAFGVRGDPNWQHNFPDRPMLNLLEACFFWIGVGFAALRWKQPAFRMLLLWLGVLLLPALLSRDAGVRAEPNFLRMNGAAPAVYLLAGAGVWRTFRFLTERFVQNFGSKASAAMGVAVSVLILVQGGVTYRTYFLEWAAAPEIQMKHGAPMAELAQMLNGQSPDAGAVYLVPNLHANYSFAYLYQGAAPAYLFHPAQPDLARKIESALRAEANVSTVKIVEWTGESSWVGGDEEQFKFLLSKYGRTLDSEEWGDFLFHNYAEISLDSPWSVYQELEPPTVDYDGGIRLLGLALGQGAEQLSARPLLEMGRSRPLWMALQWQTAPGLTVDYAVSLRLYNAKGEKVHQEDHVLWNPSHRPTSHWLVDEPVDTLSMLDFADDLPAGDYEFRMVVYNFETQAPTVEIGVWEPETTLARVRLAQDQ